MKILDTPRSGSVAGTTASRNRFGQYYRSRATPVQPRTGRQTNNRARLTAGSSGWRSFPDAQRTLWNDYAAQITRTDRLGSGYSPTGASLATGAALINNGLPMSAPATLPNYVSVISAVVYVDSTPGPESLKIYQDVTDLNNVLLVQTSGPVSPGITSAAAVRRWRALPAGPNNQQVHLFPFDTVPIPILTQYKYLFPSPVAGQVIWFRVKEIFYDGAGGGYITNTSWQTYRMVVA